MPSVNVMINGKNYRMACDEGQEQHLINLGAKINSAIDELRGAFGEIGDQRLIVMAAITMADSANEARGQVDRLQAELAMLRDQAAKQAGLQPAAEAETAAAVSEAARLIADIARRLNASN